MKARRVAVAKAAVPITPPVGKHIMPALEGAPNALEEKVLGGLDPDKLNQLAECLFTLNSRRFGPIPGAYVVVDMGAGTSWCVGQLSADRARPLVLFEELEFDTPAAAKKAAERLRRSRGERAPVRSL